MIRDVRYLVRCKELGIFKEFADQETAHTFATQLKQDYPTAHIEKAKVTLFLMNGNKGAKHERISQNPKPIKATKTHL